MLCFSDRSLSLPHTGRTPNNPWLVGFNSIYCWKNILPLNFIMETSLEISCSRLNTAVSAVANSATEQSCVVRTWKLILIHPVCIGNTIQSRFSTPWLCSIPLHIFLMLFQVISSSNAINFVVPRAVSWWRGFGLLQSSSSIHASCWLQCRWWVSLYPLAIFFWPELLFHNHNLRSI